MSWEKLRSVTVAPASLAAIAMVCALAMGGAALADETGTDDDSAPPPPTVQEPPHVSIDMELCVGQPESCHTLPSTGRVPAGGSVTLTVECVNDGDDDDCADTPFDKASVNGTEKDLVNDAASFDLDDLVADETRAMEVSIRSSTNQYRYEAGVNFNIVVER